MLILTVRRLNPAVDFNDRQEISRSVRHLQAVQRISTKFRIVLQKGGFIAEGCFWVAGNWGWFSDKGCWVLARLEQQETALALKQSEQDERADA
jgi:hypothetical protein